MELKNTVSAKTQNKAKKKFVMPNGDAKKPLVYRPVCLLRVVYAFRQFSYGIANVDGIRHLMTETTPLFWN
jgi:hypothetical protein